LESNLLLESKPAAQFRSVQLASTQQRLELRLISMVAPIAGQVSSQEQVKKLLALTRYVLMANNHLSSMQLLILMVAMIVQLANFLVQESKPAAQLKNVQLVNTQRKLQQQLYRRMLNLWLRNFLLKQSTVVFYSRMSFWTIIDESRCNFCH